MVADILAIAKAGSDSRVTWHVDWAWSLPLIVLNVVIHVLGLGVINEGW
jgi:hypothetical protein